MRAIAYDKTARLVCGKTRKPRTSFIATSNVVPVRAAVARATSCASDSPPPSCAQHERDDAFWQRNIFIHFAPLKTDSVDDSTSADDNMEWSACKKLLSALLPDLTELLYDGKLDALAINDCCTFMGAVINKKYCRNANGWGFVLYFMLLLETLALGKEAAWDPILEYITTQCGKQTFIASKFTSTLERFVLAIHRVRNTTSLLDRAENVIFWHHFRCVQDPVHAALEFVCVRVDLVCTVIQNVLKERFQSESIKREVEHSTFAHYGKAKFYKVDELQWPIVRVEMDMDGGPSQKIPLQEGELTDDMLRRENCLMFKKTDWVRITSEVDAVQNLTVDFKNITITSALDQTPYNFYDALLNSTWFGFRALDSNNLRGFYDMVGVHSDHNLDEVVDNLHYTNLAKYYGYGFNTRLPYYLAEDPFAYADNKENVPPSKKRKVDLRSGESATEKDLYDEGSSPGASQAAQDVKDTSAGDADSVRAPELKCSGTHPGRCPHSPNSPVCPLFAVGRLGALLRHRLH